MEPIPYEILEAMVQCFGKCFHYKDGVVEGKFSGTRGLFISIPGFRKEVVQQFDERGSSIILMEGMDLMHVLEGRVDLRDGLRKKVEAAAQKGLVLTPIFP